MIFWLIGSLNFGDAYSAVITECCIDFKYKVVVDVGAGSGNAVIICCSGETDFDPVISLMS